MGFGGRVSQDLLYAVHERRPEIAAAPVARPMHAYQHVRLFGQRFPQDPPVRRRRQALAVRVQSLGLRV
jgi:hypothetical protein